MELDYQGVAEWGAKIKTEDRGWRIEDGKKRTTDRRGMRSGGVQSAEFLLR
jgi:hypothetical protein